MNIRLTGLSISLAEHVERSGEEVRELLTAQATEALGLPPDGVHSVGIRRRSLDARKRGNIRYVYTVEAETSLPESAALPGNASIVKEKALEPPVPGNRELRGRPVVIGAGPTGLFAAWQLAAEGYQPLLIERGKPVEERRRDTAAFWKRGELDPDSNVLFGEGGAGTFSDGKLTTRGKDPLQDLVLDLLVEAGAPESVRYDAKPHLGTDRLQPILQALRSRVIESGAEVRFGVRCRDLILDRRGAVVGLDTTEGTVDTSAVILAIGHSARDSYRMLLARGVMMEPKPMAVGVRVQHRQELINRAQYGLPELPAGLEAAEYVLKCPTTSVGRSVYSFCMCPGGAVVACASEPGMVCCNGMSGRSRSGPFANGAIVAQVSPADYPDSGPLGGVAYQEGIERAAFAGGGSSYALPYMPLDDLVRDRPPRRGLWRPPRSGSQEFALRSFPRGEPADLRPMFAVSVMDAVREASRGFARSIPGWLGSGAVAFGAETRTSSPVRIVREADGQSPSTPGLFPAGEGAGYAGGIVSAATDGIRAARSVISQCARLG